MLKVLFYSGIVFVPMLVVGLKHSSSFSPIGFLGIVMCILLSVLGTTRGMSSIARYTSGVCISTPRVGKKSVIGTVLCEAGMIISILHIILMSIAMKNMPDKLINNSMVFCSGMVVGSCFYFSLTAVGMICGVIGLADAKNSDSFFKVMILEFMPASVGLLGFILGVILLEKAKIL